MLRCFILVGGQGTRLYPLTNFIHKAMIPIRGKPVLEYTINHLRNNDITDIVLCCSSMSCKEQFKHYFGDGSRFGVKLKYCTGPKKLATAGRILDASRKNLIDGKFMVYYGDILTNLDLKEVCNFHLAKRGTGTIVFSPKLAIASGVAVLEEGGKVKEVEEKPLLPLYTNIGVYVLEPKILEFIEPRADFFADTFPRAIDSGISFYGYIADFKWLDVGSFQNLQTAEKFVTENFRGKAQ